MDTERNQENLVSNLDTESLERALKGDPEAYTAVVEAYQVPVYNLCFRMLGSPQEAEDAAQETFWRAYQAMGKYDHSRSFMTWLLSIAAHYCIDQHRKRKLPSLEINDAFEEFISDGVPSPESSYSQGEQEKMLRNLLKELNPQDRAAVVMRYWYDFSEQEIADSLSLSTSAVKSRLFRARQQLARSWKNVQAETLEKERSRDESPAF
jgi:RNA polymerase sigma-70 factor, ECF subfamily